VGGGAAPAVGELGKHIHQSVIECLLLVVIAVVLVAGSRLAERESKRVSETTVEIWVVTQQYTAKAINVWGFGSRRADFRPRLSHWDRSRSNDQRKRSPGK